LTLNVSRIKATLSERGRCGRDHMVVGFITTYAFLLPLMLWVGISLIVRCIRYNSMW